MLAERTWLAAEVIEYSVEPDPLTRTYDVVIGLQPPLNMELLPGMSATVSIGFGTSTPAEFGEPLVVPVEAVFGGNEHKGYVWMIPPQGGLPQKVEVSLGAIHDIGVEVKGQLVQGDYVAVAGVHSLLEDALVRPMEPGQVGLD